MAPRRLDEVMLEPDDRGRPSSLNVGRLIGGCSSGDVIIFMRLLGKLRTLAPDTAKA